MENANSDVTV